MECFGLYHNAEGMVQTKTRNKFPVHGLVMFNFYTKCRTKKDFNRLIVAFGYQGYYMFSYRLNIKHFIFSIICFSFLLNDAFAVNKTIISIILESPTFMDTALTIFGKQETAIHHIKAALTNNPNISDTISRDQILSNTSEQQLLAVLSDDNFSSAITEDIVFLAPPVINRVNSPARKRKSGSSDSDDEDPED